ncbi:hypothetical protein [Lentzea flava]|uniref:Lipoprotein LprG n=1 Tax=Lentzea flava TaxID=103732 RepID=A0ABQ2UBY8_9PSEU|nr:hypothetical protein [Lentzea flava]MCP2197551.1 hypothetical protein [Lentzea flava]GGU20438.1 hypothetical protein GCM10010178_10770 [Lentzea flava]
MRKTVLALALAVTACSSTPDPRPLSVPEAERLALVRFSNYTTGIRAFTASVPSPGGKLVLDGRVDFVNHLGYAGMRTDGRDDEFSRGLVQWNLGRMAFATNPSAKPVDPVPMIDWQVRDLRERGSELDGALRLLVNLGSDRPENAQLLLQSSARWLRSDRIGDTAVDVFEGPKQKDATDARLRYWLDADGKLRRLEAKLGTQEELAVFDFTGQGDPVQVIPPLTR